ncbi:MULTISPECIES: helix-turn-helix domain-containing protein [Niastella]|uniref:Helix-turn-helix domain-containing protein n=1 Tax=Niastella soli TaxID=2821487 RepID=A0ABS3YW91_9BACT|nr:helix-turn-helix domain-containing protein [Niastella soli]MBO9202185.1 helix-turn-helix domain-containing protein [Niastella soli]
MQISDVFTIEKFRDKCFGPTELTTELFNKILVIEKGRGELELAYVPHTISRGKVYLIGKDKRVVFGENKISGYLLQFDDSFWQKTPLSANNCKEVLFNRSIDSFTLIPDKQHFDHLLELLELTYCDFELPDYSNKPDVLAAYLKVIIIKTANIHFLLKADTSSYDSKLFERFVALVSEKGNYLHKVDDHADALGISTRKLSDVCKSKGKNAKKMILQHLVNEAKKDLQFTSRSIKEIAGQLHFANPYQFSNFFKNQTGYSPNQYRDQFVKIGI